jgi:hypothetical protein
MAASIATATTRTFCPFTAARRNPDRDQLRTQHPRPELLLGVVQLRSRVRRGRALSIRTDQPARHADAQQCAAARIHLWMLLGNCVVWLRRHPIVWLLIDAAVTAVLTLVLWVEGSPVVAMMWAAIMIFLLVVVFGPLLRPQYGARSAG